jgi:hypothetical protein
MLFIQKCRPAAKKPSFTQHSNKGSSFPYTEIYRSFQENVAFSDYVDPISPIALPKNVISGCIDFRTAQICHLLEAFFLQPLENLAAFQKMDNL